MEIEDFEDEFEDFIFDAAGELDEDEWEEFLDVTDEDDLIETALAEHFGGG